MRLSEAKSAIQKVKPHKIGIQFPKRAAWTPTIPASGPKIPDEILRLAIVKSPSAAAQAPKAQAQAEARIPEGVPRMRDGRPKYQDAPVTNIRNVIAKRLTESKQTIPHQYTSVKVAIDNAISLRKTLKESGASVSMNDIVLKGVSLALKQVPELNAVWSNGDVQRLEDVDMCIAVATDSGLFAPKLSKVDKLGLTGVNQHVKDVANRAKSGKLTPNELAGGGFSVSNLGMFGITEFTAVINPPQAGILAVGGIEKELTLDGYVNTMTLTLSSDGRSVDANDAFVFCEKLKAILENPRIMLML